MFDCLRSYPKIQKSVETWPLLAPHLEAVGLPITVRTSNYNPTPICKITPAKFGRCTLITYPWASIVAIFLDSNLRVSYASKVSRTKRVIYAFLNIWYPTPPKELFPDGIPCGFYTTSGVKTQQKYIFIYIWDQLWSSNS